MTGHVLFYQHNYHFLETDGKVGGSVLVLFLVYGSRTIVWRSLLGGPVAPPLNLLRGHAGG